MRFLAALPLLLFAANAAADPAIPTNLAVYGPSGLQLAGATLFKGPVDGAEYDAAHELIWFKSKDTLQVIDLRDAAKKPVVIAKKVPTDSWAVSGLSEAQHNTDYTNIFTIIHLDKKPYAEAGQGAYMEVDGESDARLTKKVDKVKIVGTKWVKAQLGRIAVEEPKERAEPPKVAIKVSPDDCEDEEICGTAQWLGGSPYQLLIVEHTCGDACHQACVLYDPKSKQFASPLTAATWGALDKAEKGGCEGYMVEPNNGRYFAKDTGTLCTLGAKSTCSDLSPWLPFAWVGASK
ncbi:MAG TPA: hypothetical protein VL463_31195 [Kofleriaceae bacterium]|nr:hypothetical protein [Kofleriaceae bacterium]